MPGEAVELLSAMLSVEDIAEAPQARLSLTGGTQKRHGEALVQWSVPRGAVGLLSAMLSVKDIAKAPQTRLNPTEGRGAGQRQYGGALGQRARGFHGTTSTLGTGWGIITGATQTTIQCTCWSLIGGW